MTVVNHRVLLCYYRRDRHGDTGVRRSGGGGWRPSRCGRRSGGCIRREPSRRRRRSRCCWGRPALLRPLVRHRGRGGAGELELLELGSVDDGSWLVEGWRVLKVYLVCRQYNLYSVKVAGQSEALGRRHRVRVARSLCNRDERAVLQGFSQVWPNLARLIRYRNLPLGTVGKLVLCHDLVKRTTR
jgi:hypothetical protein